VRQRDERLGAPVRNEMTIEFYPSAQSRFPDTWSFDCGRLANMRYAVVVVFLRLFLRLHFQLTHASGLK
jgi:hypothetical protein